MNIKKYTIGILEILVMQLQLPAPEKKVRLQVTRKGELCHFDPSGIGILENLIIDCRTIIPPDCRFTLISIIRF